MPRATSRSSGSRASAPARPAPRPAPASHTHSAPPPAPAAQPAPPPAQPAAASGGGSMLGGLMQTVGEGMAFGTGSAIANRAVDAIMGPRTVVHEHVNSAAPADAPAAAAPTTASSPTDCAQLQQDFNKCVEMHGSDISKCQFYLDMLTECKRNAASGNTLL
ncbi:unnamed protein product [Closterium sp. NIES-53]